MNSINCMLTLITQENLHVALFALNGQSMKFDEAAFRHSFIVWVSLIHCLLDLFLGFLLTF